MAQAKAIYTKVGVTPSKDPVALRFHAEVLRALSGFLAIWRCEPTLLQDRDNNLKVCACDYRLVTIATIRTHFVFESLFGIKQSLLRRPKSKEEVRKRHRAWHTGDDRVLTRKTSLLSSFFTGVCDRVYG